MSDPAGQEPPDGQGEQPDDLPFGQQIEDPVRASILASVGAAVARALRLSMMMVESCMFGWTF